MKLTFNTMHGNCPTLNADVTRLTAWNATARDKRRALARIFPGDCSDISFVYDLDQGESPRRAEFEKMAAAAVSAAQRATESRVLSVGYAVKRSPKYGLVTITIALPDWRTSEQAMATVINCIAAHYDAHYTAVYGWHTKR